MHTCIHMWQMFLGENVCVCTCAGLLCFCSEFLKVIYESYALVSDFFPFLSSSKEVLVKWVSNLYFSTHMSHRKGLPEYVSLTFNFETSSFIHPKFIWEVSAIGWSVKMSYVFPIWEDVPSGIGCDFFGTLFWLSNGKGWYPTLYCHDLEIHVWCKCTSIPFIYGESIGGNELNTSSNLKSFFFIERQSKCAIFVVSSLWIIWRLDICQVRVK